MNNLFVLLFIFVLLIIKVEGECPCSNTDLCKIITTAPRKELFAFQYEPDQWKYYNYSLVTTLAVFGTFEPQMICKAHENGARVVYGAGFPVNQLYNDTAISSWITSLYNQVSSTYTDGVNLDIEDPIDIKDAPALTNFVSKVNQFFKAKNSNYQITYDVAWSPNCIDGRCYDYPGIVNATDFVIVMSYDLRSQITGPCVASANSPANLVFQGILNFTKLGVPTDKLVLGMPWYGYDYPCVSLSADGVTCNIKEVPFRGVNCSDAAGTEKAYSILMNLLQNSTISGPMWSDTFESPWFNYKNPTTKQIHQVWYDDQQSLRIKAEMARKTSLRGVGMWTGDFVDYIKYPIPAQAFWAAMGSFFS